MKRVSVAMATYNGEKYLKEQIDSILVNLSLEDELIISDDGSNKETLKILDDYQKKDARIFLVNGPRKGVKKNFENALSHCQGRYIFLADQDDIWMENKVEMVLPYLKEYSVVVHDAIIVDQDGNELCHSFFAMRSSGKGVLKNIYKNTYIGCCMAFQSTLKDKIMPIPLEIEMHDQWIGILGEHFKKGCFFLPEKLILYRRHGDNASSFTHYPLKKMIKNRWCFVKNYWKRKRGEKN